MNKNLILIFLLVSTCLGKQSPADEYTIYSSDNNIKVSINLKDTIRFQIHYLNNKIVSASRISLEFADNIELGVDSKIKNVSTRQVDQIIKPVIREKFNAIKEEFNEIRLDFDDNFAIEFRAYNEGVAYRFITNIKDDITIKMENIRLNFTEKDSIYFQRSQGFASAYETPYEHTQLSGIGTEGIVCLPALVKTGKGINILITESDLVDYPGMWFMDWFK